MYIEKKKKGNLETICSIIYRIQWYGFRKKINVRKGWARNSHPDILRDFFLSIQTFWYSEANLDE